MKKRVLFVDDEASVLQGLQRLLFELEEKWEMRFLLSAEEALEHLRSHPCEVLVTDMKMPGMSGAQLLTEVRRMHPGVVRIVLTGQTDRGTLLKAVSATHMFLSKPCDAEMLERTVERACSLQSMLRSESLRQLAGGMESLPSPPTLYHEFVSVMQRPDVSVNEISSIIVRDMGITAKLLQFVNSAFFGLPRRITNPAQAISLLGMETVKGLILGTQVFSSFDESLIQGARLDSLWDHSFRVAIIARNLARAEKLPPMGQDDCFTGALLHDVGKLVLASSVPDDFAKAIKAMEDRGCSASEAELEVFGASHAEVGAYLIDLWGIPGAVVEAIGFHHRPGDAGATEFTALTAVHAANAFDIQLHSAGGVGGGSLLDEQYLKSVGLDGRVSEWRRLALAALDEEAVA